MRIAIVGPGRAGTALAIAARRALHDVVAIVARRERMAVRAADRLGAVGLPIGADLPECDLVVVAVRDDAIADVASALVPSVREVRFAAHLSGAVSVEALAPLVAAGVQIGSFHPLQTLPNPEAGARQLAGAWFAVTATEPMRGELCEFARSLGATPFDLANDVKILYHAAAAAAANFPIAALAMSNDLFERAGVPWRAARPLVEAIVANAFELGPREALTGPIARGDTRTVERQVAAIAAEAPEWLDAFQALVAVTAEVAGRKGEFGDLDR